MKANHHDISVNVGDGVSIKLPRLRFEIERRQAERLRDVLNTVLPVSGQPAKVARTLRLLHLWGDVDPEISGPYDSDEDRLAAAQDYRRAHGEENGVFKLDVTGDVEADVLIESYTGGDLEMPKPSKWVSSAWVNGRNAMVLPVEKREETYTAWTYELHVYETRNGRPTLAGKGKFPHHGQAWRAGETWTLNGEWDLSEAIRGCCLCKCTATGEVSGLPVCDYHADHTEDDPRCPDCVPVHTGDRVRDPLDGTWRTVARLDLAESTAHMADGGCMSIDEAGACEKRLPSESLEDDEHLDDGRQLLRELRDLS